MHVEDVGKLYPVAKAILTPLFRASWRFEVRGLENVPTTGGAVLCPNHTSVLDSFFVPTLLPRRVTYVGKAEYMDDWKTRKLFPALGMIPIDREGGDAGERALATAQRVIEQGQLFGIYPEGTRSRDGRLYRGHTGPARLALRTGVPIIPVGITGARDVMPPDARFPKLRLPVSVTFGRPVEMERYSGRENDRMVLRQIIDEVMYSIREITGQEYVDEYASKKKAAPEPVDAPTTATAEDRAGLSDGRAPTRWPVSTDAPVEADAASQVVDLTASGSDGGSDEELLVAAAARRSSADVLARPVRRFAG